MDREFNPKGPDAPLLWRLRQWCKENTDAIGVLEHRHDRHRTELDEAKKNIGLAIKRDEMTVEIDRRLSAHREESDERYATAQAIRDLAAAVAPIQRMWTKIVEYIVMALVAAALALVMRSHDAKGETPARPAAEVQSAK